MISPNVIKTNFSIKTFLPSKEGKKCQFCVFSFLLQKCTSAGTNSHHSSQQQNRASHCSAPSTTPFSVLFLQLATSERCPDFSDQASAWPPLSVNPWGQLSPCHQFLRHTIVLFQVPGDTQAPLESPYSSEPISITPVLGCAPWSSTDTNTPHVGRLQ